MPEPTPERPSLAKYLVRPQAAFVVVAEDCALGVLAEPAECPLCHRSVVLVVNRRGHTRCVACDWEAYPVRRAWAGGAA